MITPLSPLECTATRSPARPWGRRRGAPGRPTTSSVPAGEALTPATPRSPAVAAREDERECSAIRRAGDGTPWAGRGDGEARRRTPTGNAIPRHAGPPRLRDLRASRPEPRKGPGGAHPCGAVASSLNDARIRNLRRSMRDSIRHSFRSTIAPSNPSFQSRDAEQVLRPIVGHYRSTDWQILGKPV